MAVSFLCSTVCSAFAARETRTHAQWFKFELSVKKGAGDFHRERDLYGTAAVSTSEKPGSTLLHIVLRYAE